MPREMSVWRLAVVAAVGALLVEVVLIVSEGVENTFTVARIPNHLAALAVGGLLGWMYELLRELSAATTSSLRDISSLTAKIKYQDEALSMLTDCPRHNAVMTELIGKSMQENFRNIPYVGEGEYLGILSKAVQYSNGFEGIQRKPLRWFKANAAGSYLETLRDHRMAYKTRIFVLDESDVVLMEEDLQDAKTLSNYWTRSGNVDSYWLSTVEFKQHIPALPVPDDFALYDGSLLIAYDPERQVLSFDLVSESDRERKIFARQRELAGHGVEAFRPIPKEPAVKADA